MKKNIFCPAALTLIFSLFSALSLQAADYFRCSGINAASHMSENKRIICVNWLQHLRPDMVDSIVDYASEEQWEYFVSNTCNNVIAALVAHDNYCQIHLYFSDPRGLKANEEFAVLRFNQSCPIAIGYANLEILRAHSLAAFARQEATERGNTLYPEHKGDSLALRVLQQRVDQKITTLDDSNMVLALKYYKGQLLHLIAAADANNSRITNVIDKLVYFKIMDWVHE
jgi:hypothetical protein